MMEVVHRYEDTVNQVLGDGIMALFGAPIAHEDHAVQACSAALARGRSSRFLGSLGWANRVWSTNSSIAQREPPTLLAGDALTVLPQAVAQAPADTALCVFHIATLAHFPPEARERFRTLIADLARRRDLFWLSSEGVGLGDRRRQGEYVTILTAFQRIFPPNLKVLEAG